MAGAVNFSCAIRPKVANCSDRTAAPLLGIMVRWSQPNTPAALLISWISASFVFSCLNFDLAFFIFYLSFLYSAFLILNFYFLLLNSLSAPSAQSYPPAPSAQ